jgi:small subunit ribosomal protein S18
MAAPRRKFAKKYCKYSEMKVEFIDYKNLELIKMSLSERGKIMPRRLTGTSKRAQEMLEITLQVRVLLTWKLTLTLLRMLA